jgi:ABC-type branched-subunit amino acid transport system permease subunit
MVLFAVLGKFFNLTGGTDGLRLERAPFFGMNLERDAFESVLLVVGVVLALLLRLASTTVFALGGGSGVGRD